MQKIAVIHGPNLNLLGQREPGVYGHETLADINQSLLKLGAELGVGLETFQSNAEHELVEYIHQCRLNGVEAVIINPAAFTHTSVALRDALLGTEIPFVEVHLSNVHAREPFRSHSYFSDVALGTIVGLGSEGYRSALRYLANKPK